MKRKRWSEKETNEEGGRGHSRREENTLKIRREGEMKERRRVLCHPSLSAANGSQGGGLFKSGHMTHSIQPQSSWTTAGTEPRWYKGSCVHQEAPPPETHDIKQLSDWWLEAMFHWLKTFWTRRTGFCQDQSDSETRGRDMSCRRSQSAANRNADPFKVSRQISESLKADPGGGSGVQTGLNKVPDVNNSQSSRPSKSLL